MSQFDTDRLKATAREMAGGYGVEKSPAEWDAYFRGMIDSYRAAAREAGSPMADQPDEVIWDRIRELAGVVD